MNKTKTMCLSKAESSIIKVLLYSDIFKYPLKADEIQKRLDVSVTDTSEIEELLQKLAQNKLIQQNGEYFSVNAIQFLDRRLKGNLNAKNNFLRAFEIAELISKFPYVQAVFLSGSISKNFMDDKSDIDFFIITDKNRMWISRTLLILYKKIILLNNKEHFCLNYFIDMDHLEIPEQNLFTATEIVTVIPAFGKDCSTQFYNANSWVEKYYPNYPKADISKLNDHKPSFRSKVESFFSGKLGDWLEPKFMNLTLNFWKKKFNKIPKEDFDLAMKTEKHASKHHPNNYQKKVLNQLGDFIADFEKTNDVSLEPS